MIMAESTDPAPGVARPVDQTLVSMGLPRVPAAPVSPPQQDLPVLPKGIPEPPAVPGFDIGALVAPMTDLLSTFGSGTFSGVDPSAMFEGASKALEQGASMAMQAVNQLASVWQGPAATAAAGKGLQAAASTGMTAEQGAEISTAVGEAAAVVGAGEAELQAIIDSFMAVISALGPSLWLPPGQAAAVASAQEHLAHALEVVARVKGELSGLSGQVAAAGRKVPVTTPPTTAATTVVEVAATAVPAVISAATSIATAVGTLATNAVQGAFTTATRIAASASEAIGGVLDDSRPVVEESSGVVSQGAGSLAAAGYPIGAGSGAALAGGSGAGAAPRVGSVGTVGLGVINPAPAQSNTAPAQPRIPPVDGGARTVAAEAGARAGVGSGMLPMTGAGTRAAQPSDHGVPDYLVTTDNGAEVVGELPLVGPQVVGDAEPVATTVADVTLTL